MKIKTKALVIIACVVMIVTVGIMGTIAYLTTSVSVENTFTVGKVEISLDEAKVDENGLALTGDKAERVQGNTYTILPGGQYDKDPTVTVKAGSAKCYVRLKITVKDVLADDSQKGIDLFREVSKKWTVGSEKGVHDTEKDVYTFYAYYSSVVEPSDEETKLDPVFKGFNIPETLTTEQFNNLNDAKITVCAEAIQADGFDTEAEAWAAFDAQNK